MNERDTVGFLAVGQAGQNIGKILQKKGHKVFYINSSPEDMKLLDEDSNRYLISSGEGSARKRGHIKELVAGDYERILGDIKAKMHTEFIFVIFSAGGGTGSGASPFLIDILINETDKKIGACVILPDRDEAPISLANAYECAFELNEIEGLCACFFIDNSTVRDMFEINNVFANHMDTLLNANKHFDDKGNIDREEIKTLLETNGAAVIGMGKKQDRENNGTDETAASPAIVTQQLVGLVKNSIYAPVDNKRSTTYIGLSTADEPDIKSLMEEFGGLGVFQGRNPSNNFIILTGLTFPVSRLKELRDASEKSFGEVAKVKQEANGELLAPLTVSYASSLQGKGKTGKTKNDIVSRYLKKKNGQ